MKKYFSIFSITFANTTVYRFGLLFDTFQSFLAPTFILLALSYTKSTTINFSNLLPYYLIISILGPLIQPKVHDYFFELERSGEAANFLGKPISLYKYLLATFTSQKVSSLLALLPLLALILFLLRYSITPISLLIIPLSFLLYFNISYLVGLLCFWFEEFWALSNLFEASLFILAGVMLPYQFFPDLFNSLILYTPFPYTLNWFARTTMVPPTISEVIIASLWIVFTYFFAIVLERKAIKHLTLVGN